VSRRRRRYPKDPDGGRDGVVDLDAGSSSLGAKQAAVVAASTFQDRQQDRAGYRDLDTRVEQAPGLSRATRDRNRATPRDTSQPLGHPRKARHLPEPDAVRIPISARQRKERSKTKREAQDQLSGAVYRELDAVLTRPARWTQLNDALSAAAGDAQQLPESQLAAVQRVDRAIQAYEAGNDRSHVVYATVELPDYVTPDTVIPYVRARFRSGAEVAFDRYTGAAHCLHELDGDPHREARALVVEVATRRGMYLGRSGSLDDTAHLLPRGLRLRAGEVHDATYQRPDGSRGSRHVLRLTDTDQEKEFR
jgi:hypothetical protein